MIPAHGLAKRRHLQLVPSPPPDSALPRTRGDCKDGYRPCAITTCKFNLCVDVTSAGTLVVHWLPEDEPERPNCALDAADLSGLGPTDVGLLMRVTTERVNQIERKALRKIKRRMARHR